MRHDSATVFDMEGGWFLDNLSHAVLNSQSSKIPFELKVLEYTLINVVEELYNRFQILAPVIQRQLTGLQVFPPRHCMHV